MIIFEHIYKSYNESIVVNDLSWEIRSGELFVIMGSSGSGKSTALKMINRLVEPTSGSIIIDNVNIRDIPAIQLRRSMGYVFQKIGLFPHMTVEENIRVVLRIHHKTSKHHAKYIDDLLTLVNLDPGIYRNRYPKQLSGGQQQRVGIARALAIESDYILMDEPFSALDAITRELMQQEIRQLQKRIGKTVIFVTHDLFEAVQLADRIAVMNAGKLQQIGTPSEIIKQPATEFVVQLTQPYLNQIVNFSKQVQTV